jgi:hypothetical protein
MDRRGSDDARRDRAIPGFGDAARNPVGTSLAWSLCGRTIRRGSRPSVLRTRDISGRSKTAHSVPAGVLVIDFTLGSPANPESKRSCRTTSERRRGVKRHSGERVREVITADSYRSPHLPILGVEREGVLDSSTPMDF